MKKIKVIDTSTNCIILCNDKSEAVVEIVKLYQQDDVEVDEFLDNIEINNLSVQEVVDIVGKIINIINGDELIQEQYASDTETISVNRSAW